MSFPRKLLIALLVAPMAAPSVIRAEEDIDSARATLAKWMETRQVISKEKEAWALGKEVLQQRIDLLRSEVDAIKAKIEATRGAIGEADTRKGELDARRRDLDEAADSLGTTIAGLEARTKSLLEILPEPVLERVKVLSQRLPDDPEKASLTLGERFQNVIGILNEVNKFNQDITMTSEMRVLDGGVRAEVQALYIGIGQAYYVTQSGDAAGVGRPGPDGWEWQPMNELADEILQTMAILKNEQVPGYVPLPVVIR